MTRFSWTPDSALRTIERSAHEAEERAGDMVLERATGRVPYRTGELADSGEVRGSDQGVEVVYTAEHARFVHAHPEWDFGLGRSGHWLEETMEASADEVDARMADTLRAGWPR